MAETSSAFKKLDLEDHAEIAIVNAPASWEPEIASLRGVVVRRSLAGRPDLVFSIAFVAKQPEVDALAKAVAK